MKPQLDIFNKQNPNIGRGVNNVSGFNAQKNKTNTELVPTPFVVRLLLFKNANCRTILSVSDSIPKIR